MKKFNLDFMLYNQEAINRIKDRLTQMKKTLSVAESVTSGHLQAAFSSALNASLFFQGGITTYNAGQKCRHLSIEPINATANECVTSEVAKAMALHVNKLFVSHYGIAITGFASKMPEKGVLDLYAYFAIAEKDNILVCEKLETEKERVEAQIDYARQVIEKFETVLANR